MQNARPHFTTCILNKILPQVIAGYIRAGEVPHSPTCHLPNSKTERGRKVIVLQKGWTRWRKVTLACQGLLTDSVPRECSLEGSSGVFRRQTVPLIFTGNYRNADTSSGPPSWSSYGAVPKRCRDSMSSRWEGHKYFREVNTVRGSGVNTNGIQCPTSCERWQGDQRKRGKRRSKSKETLPIAAIAVWLSVSSLTAAERSVLWLSLQAAVGSQPRAGPGPHCREKEASRHTFTGACGASMTTYTWRAQALQ